MNKLNKFLLIIFLGFLGMVSYKATYALFSDSATSISNTFAAASVFPTPSPTPSPSPSGIASHLVISEVELLGATAGDEFVEIYNPTDSQINLSILPLKLHIINSASNDDNKNLTFINSIIPARGFFLIGPSTGYTGVASLDATYSTSGNTLVPNGSVYISTSTSEAVGIIDLVGFGNATGNDVEGNPMTNPTSNNSAERKALSTSDAASMTSGTDVNKGNGYDTNNNFNDFILRTEAQPQNSGSATETP